MANDNMSAEHEQAAVKFAQAQEAYGKRHLAQALQLAQEALDIDNRYKEVHHWLAERYLEIDEPKKASREYQDLLRVDHDDQKAWEGLQQVDPVSAERMKRLSTIGPDPFVSPRRRAGDTEQFKSLDSLEAEGEQLATGEETSGDVNEMGQVTEAAAEAELGVAPPPWEFEQDRQYLQRWIAEPTVAMMISTIRQLWAEPEVFEATLTMCAHATERLHAQIFAAAGRAGQCLGVELPDLYILPERTMHSILVKDKPAILAVATRLLRVMDEPQLAFVMGRELGYLRSGYLAALQAVEIITGRKPRMPGDCADTLRETLIGQLGPWEADLDIQAHSRLQKLGHAWQQRAELSADRAGLLCCPDVQTAATAIAKTTADDADQAERVTLEQFLGQFEGQQPQQLAAIPVAEAPRKSPAYGAYRIQMLQWWATTAECSALREQTAGQESD